MEIVVPGCVGVLAAACAWGLLPGGGADAAAAGPPLGEAAVRVAEALGGALRDAGLLDAAIVQMAVGELRAHPPGRLVSACAGDDASALGLLALLAPMCGAAGALISGSPLGMLAATAPLVALPARAATRARARERKLEGAMPEAFGALAIALGSGHSLSQAMRFVGAHAAEPVRSEFMRVSFSIDCGIAATEALDGMLERLPAPGLDLVALALKVSQRTGAPLKDLLGEAAQLVGTRIELKRRLDVKTSQARMSARMVAGMPVAMIAALTLLSDDFRRGVAEPAGAVAIALALVLNVVAWVIISRVMKVRL